MMRMREALEPSRSSGRVPGVPAGDTLVWQVRVWMHVSYTRQRRRCPASLGANTPRLQATPYRSSLGLIPSMPLRPAYAGPREASVFCGKRKAFCMDFPGLLIRSK